MRTTRRAFLRTSAAATVFLGPWVRAETPRLRAAVIGHTGRGDYGHGLENIFRDRPGIELVGLADPDAGGRERMAKKIGAPRAYSDYRELLERERPDLVSLAMRQADGHHAIGLACVRAGAHVYSEKPFVRSPIEADELLAEAERLGRRIAVAHTMRMMPAMVRLRQAVREGLLGDLRELRAYGKQDVRAGGEDMMVLGTHLFDLLRMFCGDPEWVTARVLVGGRDVVVGDRRLVRDNVGWVAGEQVFAQFGFSGGIHATFTSDARLRETTGHWGIEFHGSKGVARVNCDIAPNVFVRQSVAWSERGRSDAWVPMDAALAGRAPEHNLGPVGDWLAAIEQGREPECSGRNGAWAVEMVAGVYRAALDRARVAFPLPEREHPLGAEEN